MKIILTQSIESLGREGDVVEVANGYGRNYLVPRGLAVPATAGNLKHWEQKRKSIERREAQNRAEAEEIARELEGKIVEFKAKAGEKGRLYGSVTVKDVAEAIKSQLKTEVDRKKIAMPDSIKELGEYPATIKLYPEVDATVTIKVIESEEE